MKPGHQPPDQFVLSFSARMQTDMTSLYSKMDSFIRSKYESRRWAMEGPPPADPSTLESSTPAESSTAAVPVSVAPISPPHSPPVTSLSPAPVVTTTTHTAVSRTQHQLLSAQHKRIPSNPQPVAATPTPAVAAPGGTTTSTTQNDLFTLDFSPAPTPVATAAPKKDVKNDILSLFAQAPTAAAQSTSPTTPWGAAGPNSSLFGAPQTAHAPPPSMLGASGVGVWGAGTGWSQPPAASAPTSNAFGTFGVPSVPSVMSGANIWGNPVSVAQGPPPPYASVQSTVPPAPGTVSRSFYWNVPVLT